MCGDRKSTRLNSSHVAISYAVFCLKNTATPATSTLSLHDALPISGEGPQAIAEAVRRREPARMQLGIAAGQPAGIAIGARRLVGQRRERHDLGTGRAPTRQHVR